MLVLSRKPKPVGDGANITVLESRAQRFVWA